MLKIKNNADLKELEKNLLKLTILDDYDIVAENVYCCVTELDKIDIKNNQIQDYDVQFYFNKNDNNKIAFCNYPECRNEEVIIDTLYDLIKADLVKKVGE